MVPFDDEDDVFVAGKEYFPAIPLFIIGAGGCNELSRTGGRGRESGSGDGAGVGLPIAFFRSMEIS